MRRERTNLFPCRKTQFCDTLKGKTKFGFSFFYLMKALSL